MKRYICVDWKFWLTVGLIIANTVVATLIFSGCDEQQRMYTEAECYELMPKDVNEAEAQVLVLKGRREAETDAEVRLNEAKARERIELGVFGLLVAGTLCIIFGTKGIKALGIGIIIVGFVVLAVVFAKQYHAKTLATIGLVVICLGVLLGVAAFCYAAYDRFINKKAIKEVVLGNQEWKRVEKEARPATVTLFRKIQGAKETGGIQSPSTQKVVKRVRDDEKKKGDKDELDNESL